MNDAFLFEYVSLGFYGGERVRFARLLISSKLKTRVKHVIVDSEGTFVTVMCDLGSSVPPKRSKNLRTKNQIQSFSTLNKNIVMKFGASKFPHQN